MTSLSNLDHLPPEQLRTLAAQLMRCVESLNQTVETMGKKIHRDQTVIEKLPHEIAQLKRLKFAKRSEQLNPEQASLLDDLIDTDIAAIEVELQALQTPTTATETKQKPKRTALPPEFPRALIHHEQDNTHCSCGCALKRIGEDVSEKLIQAPVPAQVIDKGMPRLRVAGPRHDREVCRPFASLPSGIDFWSSWFGHPTLNLGPVGRREQCAVAASGRYTAQHSARSECHPR